MRLVRSQVFHLLKVYRNFSKRSASTDPRSKAAFVRDKIHVNVCCLGHSGHGKTTLSSAITLLQSKVNCGVYKSVSDINKSPEEKARGQSIVPCKIEFSSRSKHYVLTDLPGSKDYLKNTISGTCGSDIAIVVVNCEEGPSEQTRQHLAIARHHGVKRLIGFINQFDKTDKESLELCELATKEMLVEEGFNANATHFISGSTIKALEDDSVELESIEKLVATLDSLPSPNRDLDSPGLFYVDKIYNPSGRGTGVTGTVKRGKITKGQIVDCLGLDRNFKTKINYIECFNRVLEEAIDGDTVELVLQGVKKEDLTRGMTVCPTGVFSQQNNFEVFLQLFRYDSNQRQQTLISTSFSNFHFETGEVIGQIVLSPGKDYITKGQSDLSQIKLSRSCVLFEGQSILLREGNQIIGLGMINRVLDSISKEEQQKMIKGRSRKEKEQFKLLVEKVENDLNQPI